MVIACNKSEVGSNSGDVEEPQAVPQELASHKASLDEFASKLAANDPIGAYSMFASFTTSNISVTEWQESFNQYYEGFMKPTVPEANIDKYDGDAEWAKMRGIPETFPLSDVVAEGTVFLSHPEGSEYDGFVISVFVVVEGGQTKFASPYIED